LRKPIKAKGELTRKKRVFRGLAPSPALKGIKGGYKGGGGAGYRLLWGKGRADGAQEVHE